MGIKEKERDLGSTETLGVFQAILIQRFPENTVNTVAAEGSYTAELQIRLIGTFGNQNGIAKGSCRLHDAAECVTFFSVSM